MNSRDNIQDIAPLSGIQEGLYFQSLMNPSSNAYFQQIKFKLSGNLDTVLLAESFQGLVNRHDILRTIITHKNAPQPLMVFLKNKKVIWKFTDLSNLENNSKDAEIQRILQDDLKKGFDFSKGNIFRVKLIKTSDSEYELVLSFHHLLMDGLSFPVLHSDLFELYRSRKNEKTSDLKAVPSYSRFLLWWKNRDQNSDREFWKRYLEEYSGSSEIPSTVKEPESENQLEQHTIRFSTTLSSNIEKLSRKYGVTRNHTILSIWGVLLSKLTNRNDVLFGITINGRPAELPGSENMVGLFINTVPFRVKTDKVTFNKILIKSKEAYASINDHQYLPLAEIQNYTRARKNLIQHILVFEGHQSEENDKNQFLPGVMAQDYSIHEQTHYALEVSIFPEKEIRFRFGYDPKRLSKWDIENLGLRLEYLAGQLLEDPTHPISEYTILPQNEREEILSKFSYGGSEAVSDPSLVGAFSKITTERSEKIAVSDDEQSLTFGELEELVNKVAVYLQHQGIKQGDRVVLLTSRNRYLPAVLFGVLKAGAAYVPLSIATPVSRLNRIVEDVKPTLILTDQKLKVEMPGEIHVANIPEVLATDLDPKQSFPTLRESDSAYVIYTSGSTGKPKGVEVTHGNLLSFFTNLRGRFGLESEQRLLALTTYTFDISGLELLGSILNGTELVIGGDSSFQNLNSILQTIKEKACTALQITPSHFAVLLESDDQEILRSLGVLLVGGEALPEKLAAQLATFNKTKVINVYGPTETTIWSTSWEVTSGNVFIGRPLLNESTHIVTENGDLSPIGVVGNLLIGGEGLAKGYWNDDKKTNEVFMSYEGDLNGRYYDTGDLARWLPDGTIEFFGRNDNQVKIRGFRVELGEIEHVINAVNGIKQAIVVYQPVQKLIHAFYIPTSNEVSDDVIRKSVDSFLPGYMVPSTFNQVSSFPLSASGKVDRKKVLEGIVQPRKKAESLPPLNEEEILIARIFGQLFPGETIGRNSHFFELGGHSLKAMALLSQIQKITKIELQLSEIFSKPVLKDLAASIRIAGETSTQPIPVLDHKDSYDISNYQKRFWVLDQLEPEHRNLYLMGGVSLLKGRVNHQALVKTFTTLMRHHEVLRTSFTEVDGIPYQQISESDSIPLYEYDFSKNTDSDNYQKAMDFVYEEMDNPFNLSEPPLWKIVLIRLKEDKHLLLLKIHHIICDASSMSILEEEFIQLYKNFSKNGNGDVSSTISIHYKDYAAWHNSRIDSGIYSESEKYWRTLFKDELPVTELPCDHQRPSRPSYDGDTVTIDLSESLSDQMKTFCQKESITLFTLYTAITSALIGRMTQQDQMVLLTPVSGRNHPDIEKSIGLFVNTVPLVLHPDPKQSFRDNLLQTRSIIEGAVSHSQYPFDKLVDDLEVERLINRPPVSGAMIVLDQEMVVNERISGLEVESVPLKMNISRNDVTFNLFMSQDSARLSITFSKDLFNKNRMSEMLRQWVTLATASINQPEKKLLSLPILDDVTKKIVLDWSHGSVVSDQRSLTICDCFDRMVEKYRDKIAVVDGTANLSYQDLKLKSDQFAGYLASHSRFKHQQPIAVLMDRSSDVVIALLAILKAGGVYLPLEKKAPVERNRIILKESKAELLITDSDIGNNYENCCSTIDFKSTDKKISNNKESYTVRADDIAYMIFTSGSTGIPKGVIVAHHSFVNMISYQIRSLEIDSRDTILQFASLAFDASLAEIFQALCSGAALTFVPDDVIAEPAKFVNFLKLEFISVATLPPAYLHTLNRSPLGELRVLMTAGEAPIPEDVHYYRSKHRYFNAYGPTEFSVCGSLQEVGEELEIENEIPMGRAVDNSTIYVLDKNRQLLPPGVTGEIYLAGAGVAKGYLDREKENLERFSDDHFNPGWRMYRTGDLGIWNEKGNLYFKGRADFQVKIRGYRVETGEIEVSLKNIEDINDAVVLVKQYSDGRKGISSFLTGDKRIEPESIRNSLSEKLPEYMIPSSFTFVDRFPLNINGKVDRAALLKIESLSDQTKPERKLNTAEKKVAGIWQSVLEKEVTSPAQHFFKSGGDSLAAIQMTTLLAKEMNRLVEVQTVFKYPVLSEYTLHAGELGRPGAAVESRKSENAESRSVSGNVDVYNEPLENLISSGKLAPLDSVALSYYSNEMVSGSGLSEEEYLQCSDAGIHIRYHITTPHGVIGVIHLPRFTSSIYQDKNLLLNEIDEALLLSQNTGASHVSLTGLIPSATDYGRDIAKRIGMSESAMPKITTGHDATAATVVRAVEKMLTTSGREIGKIKVAFLGMGSVGKSVLELMLDLELELNEVMLADLYVNEEEIKTYVDNLIDRYPHFKSARLLLSDGDIREEIYDADLIIGATNVPDLLEISKLKPGAMIVDDSGPHCFSLHDAVKRLEKSNDILFTEGGVLKTNSPADVSAYLSQDMERLITRSGSKPFDGFPLDRITGCVLSGLIEHNEKRIHNTVGSVEIADSRNQYMKLKEWGIESAPLHIASYTISNDQIERYQGALFDGMYE